MCSPNSVRARRARVSLIQSDWMDFFLIFFLPSQGQTNVNCETQSWIWGWSLKASVVEARPPVTSRQMVAICPQLTCRSSAALVRSARPPPSPCPPGTETPVRWAGTAASSSSAGQRSSDVNTQTNTNLSLLGDLTGCMAPYYASKVWRTT